jgi:mannose-1-phosphate guanylyltransferase/mannose-6-phosphate isomerase
MQNSTTIRTWGHYCVLYEIPGTKVKELTVMPGQRLSMQRHNQRAEHWFVSEGTATVYTMNCNSQELIGEFVLHQHIHIDRGSWHQLCNFTDKPCRIVEIQYGEACVEEDIERQ